jgi:hypothetical protein
VHRQASSITYLKLIGTMFMWGGTWIAGRIVAQELTAPLAAPAIRFLLAGLALAGFALVTEGRIPRLQTGSEWGVVIGLAMTHDPDQEQEMIRDSMRAFAQERLAPFAAEWDRNHTFPPKRSRNSANSARWAWSCPRNGAAPAWTTCRWC